MLELWLGLNTSGKKLLAGLFLVVTTLSGVVTHLYFEMRTMEKEQKLELAEKDKKIEIKEIALRNAEVDCGKEKLAMVEKLLEEQKVLNAKQDEINQRQNDVILSNKNYVNDARRVVSQLNKVIPKK